MSNGLPWSDAMLAQLDADWAAGLSVRLIALRLGVSKSAVAGQAYRRGLPPRPSPIIGKAGQGRLYSSRKAGLRNMLPEPVGACAVLSRKPPAPAPTGPQKAPERPAVSVPRPPDLNPAGRATCEWIDDPGPPWRKCGAPVMRLGCAWCEAHYRRAYVRTRDLREDAADYIAARGAAA